MMNITIKKYKKMPRAVTEATDALGRMRPDWKKPSKKHLQLHFDKFCSQDDRFLTLLAYNKQKLVGRTRLYKRNLNNPNCVLGGIGGVCTHPEYRRKGVATQLMKEDMKILKQQNCDIAYLCTNLENEIHLKLYSKFGFVPLGKPHTYLGKSGKRYTEQDGMLAPVKSKKVFDKVLSNKQPFDIGKGNW